MTRFARAERHLFANTLVASGPDAATLDDPWRTRDLAAHVVLRDSRPDLVLGMFVPALSGRLERAMRATADGDWTALVRRLRSGPPGWFPTQLAAVDERMNLGEMFLHHEDVLRAVPGFERRELGAPLEGALWGQLGTMAKLFLRKAPTGVVLVSPGHGRLAAKGPTGPGTVVVTGTPGELTLYVSGRQRVATVETEGPAAAVSALDAASLGG